MTTETLTTTAAATPTEGSVESNPATTQTATAADAGGQQQTEQSTTTAQAGDGKPAAEGAPESYEFVPPEGHEFDPGVLAEYSAVAKELNLSQEAAQKMLDRIGPALQARNAEHIAEATAAWESSSRDDKEFGGEALDQNLSLAKKALDTFGTPELRELLNETGLGNHPEIIRVLYRAGKAISEDTFVGGRAPAQGDARNLYSKSNMNP